MVYENVRERRSLRSLHLSQSSPPVPGKAPASGLQHSGWDHMAWSSSVVVAALNLGLNIAWILIRKGQWRKLSYVYVKSASDALICPKKKEFTKNTFGSFPLALEAMWSPACWTDLPFLQKLSSAKLFCVTPVFFGGFRSRATSWPGVESGGSIQRRLQLDRQSLFWAKLTRHSL